MRRAGPRKGCRPEGRDPQPMPVTTRSEASMALPARLLARQGSPVAQRCARITGTTDSKSALKGREQAVRPAVVAGSSPGDHERGPCARDQQPLPAKGETGGKRTCAATIAGSHAKRKRPVPLSVNASAATGGLPLTGSLWASAQQITAALTSACSLSSVAPHRQGEPPCKSPGNAILGNGSARQGKTERKKHPRKRGGESRNTTGMSPDWWRGFRVARDMASIPWDKA